MTDSTDKILKEIEVDRIRRLGLKKEDLQKSYLELEKENFPVDKTLRFIADLGGCKEIAYHYELICKDWEADEQLYLENSFIQHGREGIEFLMEQLAHVEDQRIKVFTAYLISKILSQLKHKEFYSSFCAQLVCVLVDLTNTDEPVLRRKVLIAIGWVGGLTEIDLLKHIMITDEDPLCRAWSATGLMQMSFHRVDKELICQNAKTAFVESITEESDIYTLGIIIEAAQTLFGKRWISSSDVENISTEKIEKARKSALRFLNKLL